VSKLKNHHDPHPCVNNTALSSLADLLNQKLYIKRSVLRANIRNDRYSYNKILLEEKIDKDEFQVLAPPLGGSLLDFV